MFRKINLIRCRQNVKCRILLLFTTCFVSFSFGFVTTNISKLQNNINTTEAVQNRSLEVESYQTTTNKILTQEIFNSTSLIDALDIKFNETETQVYLDHIKKKLNDEDLYEHVTDKNNVSQRSLLIKPSSRFKVPRLFRYYQMAQSQNSILSQFEPRKSYQKTEENFKIEKNEQNYGKPTEKKSFPFMIVVADGKPNKKVYFLDKPLLSKILRTPIKVDKNSADLRYDNVNENVLQTERPYSSIKNEFPKNGYSNNGDTNLAGIVKPQNGADSRHNNYLTKCFRNCVDTNISNTNAGYGDENRYDYIELMKQALVRPVARQNPANIKDSLYNILKQRQKNNFAQPIKAKARDNTVNRLDNMYNEINSHRPIKQTEVYQEDIDDSDFNNSELAQQIQEINELGKQFNDEITQNEIDRRIGTYKIKPGINKMRNNRYYMKKPVIVARSSCVYPQCDM